MKKGSLNLSKIKKCPCGFTDGLLNGALGAVFEKPPKVFQLALSTMPKIFPLFITCGTQVL